MVLVLEQVLVDPLLTQVVPFWVVLLEWQHESHLRIDQRGWNPFSCSNLLYSFAYFLLSCTDMMVAIVIT